MEVGAPYTPHTSAMQLYPYIHFKLLQSYNWHLRQQIIDSKPLLPAVLLDIHLKVLNLIFHVIDTMSGCWTELEERIKERMPAGIFAVNIEIHENTHAPDWNDDSFVGRFAAPPPQSKHESYACHVRKWDFVN